VHTFLVTHRDELIARCKVKVARRAQRVATQLQLANGVPLFLDQLAATLAAEEADQPAESLRISGSSGGSARAVSEIGFTARSHGKQMLELGYSVDQVVHDYGDLCQSITDLAFELDAPFDIEEFRTLNRCLDNAIADAVSEFTFQHDANVARRHRADENERLGVLIHELRNSLGAATLAVRALEASSLPISGAIGAVLKRSLESLANLVARALDEVRSGAPDTRPTFSLASFIADAVGAARLDAGAAGCELRVRPVDVALGIRGDRELLLAALANLLQNAFKFTRPGTDVSLSAYAFGQQVMIDVGDRCGGLPLGTAEKLFTPFTQRSEDRSGLGLGLFIARRSIEANGGTLGVRDVPGTGCVFTICLARHELAPGLERVAGETAVDQAGDSPRRPLDAASPAMPAHPTMRGPRDA